MSLKILNIDDKCTGCGACVSVCPKNALSLKYDSEGFYYPSLNEAACINCGLCERSCQALSVEESLVGKKRHYFMAKANDKDVVKASSSGGAFSVLANLVIKRGGVVYGARYNYDLERLEQASTETCSIKELRKSKYIESYTGKIYKDVYDNLKSGKTILYVGTPCQIEGLTQYLAIKRADITNLIRVRFICHGVPSNQFFTEYKHYEEKKHKSRIVAIDFRPKIRGWRNSDWKMVFENNEVEQGPYNHYYYYYYYYFQSSDILRKSCYSCARVLNDCTDITIADFWGIHKYKPENKDQEGISLIITHSQKSLDLLKGLDEFEFIEEIPESAISYIKREVEERKGMWDSRDVFMKQVRKYGYMKAVRKRSGFTILKTRVKAKIRNFIKGK